MVNLYSYDIINFVNWVREFTGKSVNITCTVWAFASSIEEPKLECRMWIDGIMNTYYPNLDMFAVQIPRIKEYLILHKEFNR